MMLPKDSLEVLWGSGDKPFADRMKEYIRTHFSELLGDDDKLLESDEGLAMLSKKLQKRLKGSKTVHAKLLKKRVA